MAACAAAELPVITIDADLGIPIWEATELEGVNSGLLEDCCNEPLSGVCSGPVVSIPFWGCSRATVGGSGALCTCSGMLCDCSGPLCICKEPPWGDSWLLPLGTGVAWGSCGALWTGSALLCIGSWAV
mmetsp:Transcript_20405/g.55635  ORF Transcript_20405/g.55635 Transcript_20405/m.55635 type:complete len:128 (-) Transcript_20405:322-705(-)